jgi:hypothetical protein
MSIPVALDVLRAEMAKYRSAGYLLSAGDGAPHVVSIAPAWRSDTAETPVLETPVLETPVLETPVLETPVLETLFLETTCGRRTAANVERQPAVALLFSPIDDGDYSLIIDATGTARNEGDQWYVTLSPIKAVLHRNATADSEPSATGCGADCRPLPAEPTVR